MTRPIQKTWAGMLSAWISWVLLCGNTCPAAPDADNPQMPPEWAAFDIVWKPTWDETLTSNPGKKWREEFSKKEITPPALRRYVDSDAKAADRVIGLRRIRLLRAMIERFPEDSDKHTRAYETIVQTSQEIMLPWWPDVESSPLGKLEELPGDNAISRRWELLAGGAKIHGADQVIDPESVDELIGMCDRTNAYLRISPSHYVSYSSALDRLLKRLSKEQLAPLRETQEKSIRFLAKELHGKGAYDEVVRLARRAPWAHSVHKLLMESGERALLDGHRHWALASFEDVLNRADDPDLLLAAHVGRWLAYSQEPSDRAWLVHAMAEVPDDAKVPWRGSKVAASELKKSLLSPQPDGSVKLANLIRNPIQLPASWPPNKQATDGPRLDFGLRSPWPVSQVQATRDAWMVFSPSVVSRFNPDGSGPVWTHALNDAPWAAIAQKNYTKALSQRIILERRPVSPRPADSSSVSYDDLTVYSLQTAGNHSVIALDAITGRLLWDTSTRVEWRGLMPMSRPVAADGRVFVLAIQAGAAVNRAIGAGKAPGPPVIWRLICMSGLDGAVIWERLLGWQPFTLVDPARGTGGLTINQGCIHLSNSMGMVAKCDVRDGAVHWVKGYPGMASPEPLADTFGREGAAPLIAGDTLFVAPRDHSGVMAFHRNTGAMLWETLAVPSVRLIGVSSQAVFGINSRRLCALDRKTGRTLWSLDFPSGTSAQGAVVGEDVIVVSAGKLHRIAASNGAINENLPRATSARSTPVLLENGLLVNITQP